MKPDAGGKQGSHGWAAVSGAQSTPGRHSATASRGLKGGLLITTEVNWLQLPPNGPGEVQETGVQHSEHLRTALKREGPPNGWGPPRP